MRDRIATEIHNAQTALFAFVIQRTYAVVRKQRAADQPAQRLLISERRNPVADPQAVTAVPVPFLYVDAGLCEICLSYTSPSPRDRG